MIDDGHQHLAQKLVEAQEQIRTLEAAGGERDVKSDPQLDDTKASMGYVARSPYQVAVANVARYIRSDRNTSASDGPVLDGFTAASVLSVAFCKAKEEILADILQSK
jgi:hypothetical protein